MANRYWVGGTGTWSSSSTTNWSATSGGASGASVPTSADNVFFNSASAAASYVVTLDSNFVGTASCSAVSAMTTILTIATVTSGAVAIGHIVFLPNSSTGGTVYKISSFGTGTGGVGTYNCEVLHGVEGEVIAVRPAYSSAIICADISLSGPAAGALSWTIPNNSGIQVVGGLTVAATGVTMNNNRLFLTGAASHTITTNGAPMNLTSVFLVGTGTYTLGSAYSSTTANLYCSLGTFTTSNFSLSCEGFHQSSSGTRTINLGSSTVTLASSGYPLGPTGTVTSTFGANVTLNAGTSTINFTATNILYVGFGSKTWYNVSFTSTSITQTTGISLGAITTDTPTFNNFTIVGQATTGVARIYLQCNPTITGTFTIGAATSPVTRLMVRSKTFNTVKTITAAAFAAGATDVDWQDITIAGAAGTISGTRFGDCGGCTNVAFAAAKTVYWNLAGTQNWSATGWCTASGGTPAAANFPLAQDTTVFDNAGSITSINIDSYWNVGSIDMSTRTSAMTWNMADPFTPTIYGNWANGSGTTLTGNPILTFSNRSIKTIDSAGKQFNFAIIINCPGGGIRLINNNIVLGYLSGNSFVLNLTLGTLDLNNLTLTQYGGMQMNTAGTRELAFGTTGSMSFYSQGNAGLNLSNVTGLTVTGTSSITFDTGGGAISFFNSASYTEAQALNLNITGGGQITAQGASVWKNLSFTGYTGSYNSNNLAHTIYGNLTLANLQNLSASTGVWTFASTSGTKTITTNGKTIDLPITFNGVGGTWQLIGTTLMGTTRTLTLTNGTLDLNGQTLTVGTAFTTATGTKNLTFNGGTLVCPTASTTAFNNAATANFSTTAGTGTGYIQMTGATAKTFVGGNMNFNCVLQQAGAGALTITGSNAFADLQATVAGRPSSILFTAGTTNTFTNFTLSGTAGNLVTIGSVTAASHTLLKTTLGAASTSYLSISRSTAVGPFQSYTTNGNVDGGNNFGWQFTPYVPDPAKMMAFFLP